MKILEGVNNINIMKIYEYFHTKDELAMIMELCDDYLLNYLSKRKCPLNSEEILEILNQLNNSFKIMIEKKINHRTLNLETILIKYIDSEKAKFIVKLNLYSFSFFDRYDKKFCAPELLKMGKIKVYEI